MPKRTCGIDHVGRQDLGVAVLAGVEVEHEVGEGALEACSRAEVDDEAGAGDFGGAVEVEDVEGLAELPVGLGGEVEGRAWCPRFSPRGWRARRTDGDADPAEG